MALAAPLPGLPSPPSAPPPPVAAGAAAGVDAAAARPQQRNAFASGLHTVLDFARDVNEVSLRCTSSRRVPFCLRG